MKDPFQQNEAGESKAGLHLSALNAPNKKGLRLSVLTPPWEKGLGLSARIAQTIMGQNTPLQHQFQTHTCRTKDTSTSSQEMNGIGK